MVGRRRVDRHKEVVVGMDAAAFGECGVDASVVVDFVDVDVAHGELFVEAEALAVSELRANTQL